MNWYRNIIASRVPTDLDVDYSEFKKPIVKEFIKYIEEILSNPNLEKIRKQTLKPSSKDKNNISKNEIGKIKDFKVFFVNGNEVKIKFFMDFVEGGNGMVYGVKHDETQPNYIPEDEIWVDADLDLSSFPYVLMHEAIEMNLMKEEKLEYDKAHQKANGVEKKLRIKKHFEK